MFFLRVVLFTCRVVILHNVIVVTEYALVCLKCCYNEHQMQKRFSLQMA